MLLGYLTTNIMQTPELRRFFVIHRTLMREGGMERGAIRLTNIEARGSKGITIDLGKVDRADSESLERLAGRIFSLEDEIRADEGEETREQIYFQTVTFRNGERRDVRMDRRTYAKRRSIRDLIDEGGTLREAIAGSLDIRPAMVDLRLEEKALLSSRVGLSVHLPGTGEIPDLTRKAAGVTRATFEALPQQLDYLRIEFQREGSTRKYLTTPGRFLKAMGGDPSGIHWESIFKITEAP